MATKTTISADCQEWLDHQEREFMKPYTRRFRRHEERDENDEWYEPGWYARLSAPGYLDCTEWCGPFDTEAEAMEELFRMFGE